MPNRADAALAGLLATSRYEVAKFVDVRASFSDCLIRPGEALHDACNLNPGLANKLLVAR
jgi:hypothetical protein